MTAFALFAAAITLGLFRWELRNIQNCNWLRKRAEALESVATITATAVVQPEPPFGIGKTEAEKWMYSVTIFAWLLLPPLVSRLDRQCQWIYGAAGVVLGFATVVSAFTPIRYRGSHRSP